jgi:autotransporter-associated beta strand protein
MALLTQLASSPRTRHGRCRSLACLLTKLACLPSAHAVNYEVYPGSAFYLNQMLDRSQWAFVADQSNGLYHHPVGFQELDDAQETTYTSHFTNRFAMVEGDMGSGSTTGDLANLKRMTALRLTPVAAFVNRPSANLAVWRQLVRNNAAEGAPSYQMLAPHRLDDSPLGWNDPIRDYARANTLVPGCAGGGVDAPVYLFVNEAQAYRQSIYDMRDWTVANGKKFNYLISPNNSYNAALLADTQATVRAMEDTGHEPDVYGVALYGLRPVELTPEKITINGVDQAAATITGLAYWLLKHRDGEPGTLDLSAFRAGTNHGAGVTSPTLAQPSQTVGLSSSASRTYTLRMHNTSPWLDYAGVLRARAHGSTQDWSISFSKGGQDITSSVLSSKGKTLVGTDRWMPGSLHEISMTVTPIGTPGPLKLIVEALPHAGVDHALDILSFESGSLGNSPPTLALNTIPQITREALPFGPLWFTCGDAESNSPDLSVTATSSNPQLFPSANITLGKNGIQRWLRLTPASGKWGSATISVTVSDGSASSTQSFDLSVERTTILPVVKANNSLDLTLSSSWQSSPLPGLNDQAVWDATVSSPNSVQLGNPLSLGGIRITNPGGDVTIGGVEKLTLGIAGVDLASASRNLFLHAPIELDEAAPWNVTSNRVVQVAQAVSGFGGISKSGNGRLELLGDDSFLGPISVSGGELLKTGAGAQSSTSVSNNAILKINHSNGFGNGGLSITTANSSSGRVELSGGISVLSGKSVTLNARSSNTDALSSLSGDNTFGGNVSLSTGGSIYAFNSAADTLTLSGNFTATATGTRNFTLRGSGHGMMTGTIADGSGVVGIIKSGTGSWTLAGNCTFSGPLNIQQGTLKITSPLPSSSSSTSTVTVSTTGTLSGSGTLDRDLVIGGIHAPGDGVGSQQLTGSVTYQNTARLQIELADQSLNSDTVLANSVTADNASIDLITNSPNSSVDFRHPFWRENRQWSILSATLLDGTFSIGSTPSDSLARSASIFGQFSLRQTSSGVDLLWTPAPPFQLWQYENFGNAWNDPLLAGPNQDPDGDAWSNENEWISGTDPKLATSKLAPTLSQDGISFIRTAGRSYRVEVASDLSGAWSLHSLVPVGSGLITIPIPSKSTARCFFRVAVTQAP